MASLMDFKDFITSTAGPDIVLAVQPDETVTHGDLQKRLGPAKKTVSNRISEALDLGLITVAGTRKPDDHGNVKRYELTPDGKRVKRALESMDYLSKKQQLLKAEREIDEILDSIYEWEVEFQDQSRTDPTKGNKQTLKELGFPGEHSYSDPLAFLQKADDWSAEEQKFFLLDSSEVDETEE